jgi:nucleoside-diphosphate-sugar epimerase
MRSTLPEAILDEAQLEDLLSDPSRADIDCMGRLSGDVLIVGAAGKMGPSLARRVHRAAGRTGSRNRVLAASRFSTAAVREGLEADGIRTVACDLLDPVQIAALPRVENVLFLAGRKFGTLDRTDVTWATNTLVPARVAEHFAQSRVVVFSTGTSTRWSRPAVRAPERTILPRPWASTRNRASDASGWSSSCRASGTCGR